jgi:hypothetical protein
MKKASTLWQEGKAPRVRRKPEMPNRTPAQLEEQILLQTRKHPHISLFGLPGCDPGAYARDGALSRQRAGLSTRLARLRAKGSMVNLRKQRSIRAGRRGSRFDSQRRIR